MTSRWETPLLVIGYHLVCLPLTFVWVKQQEAILLEFGHGLSIVVLSTDTMFRGKL